MRDGFRIFDTHTHIGTARHSGRHVSADDLLRVMDRCGVDRSLVIPFPVVDDYRSQHDLIGSAVRAYPDRLAGAACLAPFVPEAQFRDEVRRCRDEHGFRALKLQPQYHGLNPFSARSDFFFEAALENRMAVVCHTGTGAPFALPSLLMLPARRFPGLTVVAAHCGGGIYVQEAIVAALFCPNIVLELSSLMPHHVLEVMGHVPADRLMIGSDLLESTDSEVGKILTLDVSEAVKHAVLWETASRVFG
ncbi:MAG: amidohydrolase family protein [Bryobacteraceae bacterium]|nr:amidohydrolase family protein [Bryobacteraceae bacterium]